MRKGLRFTFDDKQSFQAFGIVLLEHLEDLVMQKYITGRCQSTLSGFEDLLRSAHLSKGFYSGLP